MGRGRLELPTSRLSGVRSNRLSYRPRPARSADDAHRTRLRSHQRARLDQNGPTGVGSDACEEEKRGRRSPAWFAGLASCSSDCPIGSRPEGPSRKGRVLRKEVIQPQVPLRLPCYDFTPVADPTVAACLPKVSAASSGRTNSHGVTGGVYKARERIHRGMLIRDY